MNRELVFNYFDMQFIIKIILVGRIWIAYGHGCLVYIIKILFVELPTYSDIFNVQVIINSCHLGCSWKHSSRNWVLRDIHVWGKGWWSRSEHGSDTIFRDRVNWGVDVNAIERRVEEFRVLENDGIHHEAMFYLGVRILNNTLILTISCTNKYLRIIARDIIRLHIISWDYIELYIKNRISTTQKYFFRDVQYFQ